MSEYRVGDRVRVTFEAEVVGDGAPSSACLCSFAYGQLYGGGAKIRETYLRQEGVEVEKIEPPVETFKPGERVRHRDSEFEVTIGGDGYLIHHTGGEHTWIACRPAADQFTSEWYDRVHP